MGMVRMGTQQRRMAANLSDFQNIEAIFLFCVPLRSVPLKRGQADSPGS